jgi:hypothetical protein
MRAPSLGQRRVDDSAGALLAVARDLHAGDHDLQGTCPGDQLRPGQRAVAVGVERGRDATQLVAGKGQLGGDDVVLDHIDAAREADLVGEGGSRGEHDTCSEHHGPRGMSRRP